VLSHIFWYIIQALIIDVVVVVVYEEAIFKEGQEMKVVIVSKSYGKKFCALVNLGSIFS